jgi:hypothetical protein
MIRRAAIQPLTAPRTEDEEIQPLAGFLLCRATLAERLQGKTGKPLTTTQVKQVAEKSILSGTLIKVYS